MSFLKRIPDPAVSRRKLVLGAGIFWIVGGGVLIGRAVSLPGFAILSDWWLLLPALAVGAAKSAFVFRRVVRKNISRIENLAPDKSKVCLFAFQSVESYLLVVLMIMIGLLLRTTPLSDLWLAMIYVAIGSALILSGPLYFLSYRSR